MEEGLRNKKDLEEKGQYLIATSMPFVSAVFGDVHEVTANRYFIKWKYTFDNVLLMLKAGGGF